MLYTRSAMYIAKMHVIAYHCTADGDLLRIRLIRHY